MMACISLAWIAHLFIALIIIAGVVAIVRLLIPQVAGALGSWGGVLVSALNIILWVIIGVAVVVLIFDLLACFLPRL